MTPRITAAVALMGLQVLQALPAQDRPLAIVNARILTMEGETLERGTLVIRGGVIEALGTDVQVPPGAELVDAGGGTVMPGLVSAHSRAGLQQSDRAANARFRGRRWRTRRPPRASSDKQENKAAVKAVESLYPRQEVFGELLREGITTIALTPMGNGLPGTGAVLDPAGEDLETMTVNDEAFLLVAVERDAAVKKVLKESFEKAKKIVEERKKPKEQPKAPEEKPEGKPAGQEQKGEEKEGQESEKKGGQEPEKKPEADAGKAGEQKKAEKKAEKKDPNLEVLADLLEGKRRAVLEIDSAADLLHYRDAVGDELQYPTVLVVTRHDNDAGTVDVVMDELKALECTVLLPPALSTRPRTNHLTHPAVALHEAGIEIGFHIGDSAREARQIFFRLMELVRCGLPREVALKGVTLVPAKCLGIEEDVGSLKPGKAANLLLLSGDPLDPTSRQVAVWHAGNRMEKVER